MYVYDGYFWCNFDTYKSGKNYFFNPCEFSKNIKFKNKIKIHNERHIKKLMTLKMNLTKKLSSYIIQQ